MAQSLVQVRRGSEGVIQVSQDAYDKIYKAAGYNIVPSAATPAPVAAPPTPAPTSNPISAPPVTPPTVSSNPAPTVQPIAPSTTTPTASGNVDVTKYGFKNVNGDLQGDISALQNDYDNLTPITQIVNGVYKTTGYTGTLIPTAYVIGPGGSRVKVRTDNGTGKYRTLNEMLSQGYTLEKAPGVASNPINGSTTPGGAGSAVDVSKLQQPGSQNSTTPKATLVGPQGQRVVVEVNSQDAQKYFGQGYKLEGVGAAPAKAVTMVSPSGQRVAAPDVATQQNLMKQGYTPETTVTPFSPPKPSTEDRVDPGINGVTDQNSANSFINKNQTTDSKTQNETIPTRGSNLDLSTTDSFQATLDAITKSLTSGAAAPPSAPNLTQQYTDLKTKYNVDQLEQTSADLDKQLADAQAAKAARIQGEMDKPVATGVISGRVSEVERQENERIAAIQSQQTFVTTQLKNKYDAIGNIMKFADMDYDNASTAYQQQFTRNLDAINLVRGITNDAKTQQEQVKDNARANAQIIYNTLTSGGSDISKLSDADKLSISKLELQAGLPVGFYESLQAKNPKQNVVATKESVENGRTYENVLMMDDSGNITSKRIDVGEATKGTDSGITTGQAIDIYKNFENPEAAISYFQNLSKNKGPTTGTAADGSISFRTNNPGNIKFGNFAKSLGGVDSGIKAADGGTFAAFPDYNAGRNAQMTLLTSSGYANLTLDAAMKKWSNNGYGADVVGNAIPANKKMSDLTPTELTTLQLAMQQREGYTPPKGTSSELPKPIVKDTKDEAAFYNDIAKTQGDLASGKIVWGQAFDTIKAQWGAPDDVIDKLLNKDKWYQGGAWEKDAKLRADAKLGISS